MSILFSLAGYLMDDGGQSSHSPYGPYSSVLAPGVLEFVLLRAHHTPAHLIF